MLVRTVNEIYFNIIFTQVNAQEQYYFWFLLHGETYLKLFLTIDTNALKNRRFLLSNSGQIIDQNIPSWFRWKITLIKLFLANVLIKKYILLIENMYLTKTELIVLKLRDFSQSTISFESNKSYIYFKKLHDLNSHLIKYVHKLSYIIFLQSF